MYSLQWRHNGRDGVSNHQTHHCLLNRLFRRRSKKTSKLRVAGLCAENSPGTGDCPHEWPVKRKMFPFDDVIMFLFLLNKNTCYVTMNTRLSVLVGFDCYKNMLQLHKNQSNLFINTTTLNLWQLFDNMHLIWSLITLILNQSRFGLNLSGERLFLSNFPGGSCWIRLSEVNSINVS